MLVSDRKKLLGYLNDCFESPMEDLAEDPKAISSDSVYMDFTQCEERRFDPMFHVRFEGGLPYIQMYSHILRRNKTHGIESMKLTNWSDKFQDLPKKFVPVLSWKTASPNENNSSYHRKLWMDKKLVERFLPRYCSVDHQCVLCRDVNSSSTKQCPNKNHSNRGHCVYTPTKTTSNRYKVRYQTRIVNFKNKNKSLYPKFNSSKSLKVRDWRKIHKEPTDVSEIDNYVVLPLAKFRNDISMRSDDDL